MRMFRDRTTSTRTPLFSHSPHHHRPFLPKRLFSLLLLSPTFITPCFLFSVMTSYDLPSIICIYSHCIACISVVLPVLPALKLSSVFLIPYPALVQTVMLVVHTLSRFVSYALIFSPLILPPPLLVSLLYLVALPHLSFLLLGLHISGCDCLPVGQQWVSLSLSRTGLSVVVPAPCIPTYIRARVPQRLLGGRPYWLSRVTVCFNTVRSDGQGIIWPHF